MNLKIFKIVDPDQKDLFYVVLDLVPPRSYISKGWFLFGKVFMLSVMKDTLIHLVYFYQFYKGDNFCDFVFLHISPFLKWVYSKRKEFAPKGSKFFLIWVDPVYARRQK